MDASRNPRQQAAPQISALEFDEAKETMESKYLLYQAESKASGNVGKEYGLKKNERASLQIEVELVSVAEQLAQMMLRI